MNGRAQLGWKIANLNAELNGQMQLADPADNKLCALSPLDSRLGCQSWCNWSPGQGRLHATAGWEFLWWSSSKSMQLLDDPYECKPPPEPPVTTGSTEDSSADSGGEGASSGGEGASGACTMPGPMYDVGLMGGTVLDGPRTVQTWEECCVACQGHDGCNGWAWIGESSQCDGSPCCWLKDTSSSYEEDLPGAVISYAGLVDD